MISRFILWFALCHASLASVASDEQPEYQYGVFTKECYEQIFDARTYNWSCISEVPALFELDHLAIL